MEDKTIEIAIVEYCNPNNHADIFRIMSAFEYLDYERYTSDIHNLLSEVSAGLHDNVSFLLRGLIMKHANLVLSEMELYVDPELINIKEMSLILDHLVDLPNTDYAIANEMLDLMEIVNDNEEFLSKCISDKTGITYVRVYELLLDVKQSFIRNYTRVLTDIVSSVSPDDEEETEVLIKRSRLKSIINKTLHMLNAKTDKDHHLLGLNIINDEFTIDNDISLFIKVYNDNVHKSDPFNMALDYISIMLLCSNSRHDMLDIYVNDIEDLIDDEYTKTILHKHIKEVVDLTTTYIKSIDTYGVFVGDGND